MRFFNICLLFIGFLFFSCIKNTDVKYLKSVNENLRKLYAPDKRVAIYDITLKKASNKLILEGETNSKKAYEQLIDSIKAKNIKIIDKVRVLPDSILGENTFAVAKNSVINIRSNPKHSAELGTQGLLGMPLKVIDKKGDFYRIQTPDKYISWVDKGGIQLMNKNQFDTYQHSKKVMYTKNFGYVYSNENDLTKIVSDITLGGVLEFVLETPSFYKVKYPDNRIGFIKKQDAVLYDFWLKNVNTNSENVEQVAKSFEGFPYLWGGTSSKGMDCSGFTKMVYLMNGLIIPRDASQQINAGKVVDKKLTFEGLEKGDLLFFGTKATQDKKQRVTHVGIWLGDGKFIHSSGNVHISSINKQDENYDEFNKNRYLGCRRYLNVEDNEIISLKR